MNKEIETYLLKLIKSDKYINQSLPSENFLATKFKVSRTTARAVLTKLLNKNFLKAKKGSGYYINSHINSLKLTSIGTTEYKNKEIEIIKDNDLKSILSKNDFITIHDWDNFFGFRKIYYNHENEPVLYTNSYIYKPKFKDIDIKEIQKSLMECFEQQGIDLHMQINTISMCPTTKLDQEILNTTQELTPTIYGFVISKDDQIIEIFERKYTIQNFNINYAKIY